MRIFIYGLVLSLCVTMTSGKLWAEESLYPTAIFAFQERGADVKGLGPQVADLLFASLVVEPSMYLVDREDMEKVLQEQELSVSGVVNPAEANQVGQLTGAKLLVTGSVVQAGDKLVLVAKVIGTETSRVVGASAKGSVYEDLDTLVEQLAEGLIKVVNERSSALVAKAVSRDDRIAQLREQLGDSPRPVVKISISERHVGQATIDPAAETEVMLLCKELGFEVVDSSSAKAKDAEIHIVGEGFSEFTTRVGRLAPVKARLEVKAIDPKTGRVLAIDRQTSVATDLNEQIAGKAALQEASAAIAQRLLPKLVKKAEAQE